MFLHEHYLSPLQSKSAEHSQQMNLVSVEPRPEPGTAFPKTNNSHSGYKIHQCPYCSYWTKFTTSLRNHMRVHTGEKPFSCPYCSASFRTKGRLKTHIYIHTGEKPFSCAYCSHRTNRADSLKAHILTFHSS